MRRNNTIFQKGNYALFVPIMANRDLLSKIKKNLWFAKFILNNDVNIAMKTYLQESKRDPNKAGCYSSLRLIFPILEHMSALYFGTIRQGALSKNLRDYIYDYLGKINPLYKECSGFLVYLYRHGLMHQCQPKLLKHKNKMIEWKLSYNEPKQFQLRCISYKNYYRFHLSIDKFLEDVLKSIDLYEKDCVNNTKDARNKCKKGLEEMEEVLEIKEVIKRKDWLTEEDFLFLKKNC